MAYPLDVGGVDDYPVKVGSMLLTMVEPHKGFERAYNRWYERDHFYAGCMTGPHQMAGSRWVATRDLKAMRWPDVSSVADPVDAGSYMAVYWVEEGHHARWDRWALERVRDLYARGRGFAARDHVHTATYDRLGVAYRDGDPVPVDLALDHHYPGLVAAWFDALGGADAAELSTVLLGDLVQELLGGSSIEIASSWAPRPELREGRAGLVPMDLGSPAGGSNRICQLFFVGGDVVSELPRFRRYAESIAASGLGEVVLVAPFVCSVVGTDKYVDELW